MSGKSAVVGLIAGTLLGASLVRVAAAKSPLDHQTIIATVKCYTIIEGKTWSLKPQLLHVRRVSGWDKTLYGMVSTDNVVEALVQVSTWQTAAGRWGYHSIEVARLGWGEVHMEVPAKDPWGNPIGVVFAEITKPGKYEGYWSTPYW